jgi:hypothetical protein
MSSRKPGCVVVALGTALCCNQAQAQAQAQQRPPRGQPGPMTLSALVAQGFEIKAAANTGGSAAQIFVQKGNEVFVCLVIQPAEPGQRESRCNPIN